LRFLLKNLTMFHHEHLVLILKHKNTLWLVVRSVRKNQTYVLKCS
jgi:penicillin-binding protein-related factor A (putative recombinase)